MTAITLMTVMAKVEDLLLTPITTKTATCSLAQEAEILKKNLTKSMAALLPIYGRSCGAIRGHKCGFDKSVITGAENRQPCNNPAALVFRYNPNYGSGFLYICDSCIKFCEGNRRDFIYIEEIVTAVNSINSGYTLLHGLNLFIDHLETISQNGLQATMATGERRLLRS